MRSNYIVIELNWFNVLIHYNFVLSDTKNQLHAVIKHFPAKGGDFHLRLGCIQTFKIVSFFFSF